MKIKIRAKNIEWDTDNESGTGRSLPKNAVFRTEVDVNDTVDSILSENLADWLSDEYGFCVRSIHGFDWDEDEPDLASAVRTLKKALSKRLKQIKKFEESYDFANRGRIDWEAEQKKFRKDFDELLKLGITISRNQTNNKIVSLGLEVTK